MPVKPTSRRAAFKNRCLNETRDDLVVQIPACCVTTDHQHHCGELVYWSHILIVIARQRCTYSSFTARRRFFFAVLHSLFWLLVGSFGRLAMSASRVVLPRLKSFKQVSFVASVVTSSTEKMKTKTNGECLDATLGIMWWENEIFAK